MRSTTVRRSSEQTSVIHDVSTENHKLRLWPRAGTSVLLATDCLAALVACIIASLIWFPEYVVSERRVLGTLVRFAPLYSASLVGLLGFLALTGRYHESLPVQRDVSLVVIASLSAATGIAALEMLVAWESRPVVLALLLFAALALPAGQMAKRALSRHQLGSSPAATAWAILGVHSSASRYPNEPLWWIARITKVVLDVGIATLLLLLTSPLFLALAIAARFDGGPVFFSHRRIGVGGRQFNCLKFRTMVVGADRDLHQVLASNTALAAEWEATRKLRNDPRITRLGRLLRKASLDELPQLINVVRLEMSLVGPRPITESEVPLYGSDIAHYYAVRPGLTGLWQVSGRSTTSYEQRVRLDTWYVINWTISRDLAVLLKTIPVVIGRVGAH